jgi:hypothetical protein
MFLNNLFRPRHVNSCWNHRHSVLLCSDLLYQELFAFRHGACWAPSSSPGRYANILLLCFRRGGPWRYSLVATELEAPSSCLLCTSLPLHHVLLVRPTHHILQLSVSSERMMWGSCYISYFKFCNDFQLNFVVSRLVTASAV